MATIIAPNQPPYPFYASKNMRGANGITREIFGYPIPNDHSMANGLTSPLSFPNQTTLFDVSSLTENHEVLVVGYVSPNYVSAATTYTTNWFRVRDGTNIFTSQFTNPAPPPGQSYAPGSSVYGWLGWLSDLNNGVGTYPQFKEIQENGNYYAMMTASGGENFDQRIDFAVKGIPPSVILSNKTSSNFDWLVRISEYFDSSNYIQAGICSQPFTDGQSTAPTGVVAANSAPSSNVGCATGGTVTGSATYSTYYGFVQAANGLYYQAGSTLTGRFNWSLPKESGATMQVSAAEWANLQQIINQTRQTKSLAPYSFTTFNIGDQANATWIFNQVINAIGEMNASVYPIVNTSTRFNDSALFAKIRNSLNAIT